MLSRLNRLCDDLNNQTWDFRRRGPRKLVGGPGVNPDFATPTRESPRGIEPASARLKGRSTLSLRPIAHGRLKYISISANPAKLSRFAASEPVGAILSEPKDLVGHAGIELEAKVAGIPAMWRPIAKDGADLPAGQREPCPAQLTIGVGETYDFEFRPERAGELTLEVVRPSNRFPAQITPSHKVVELRPESTIAVNIPVRQ